MARATESADRITPGKRSKKTSGNQYFDVGKVGRKTGITLRDTGIRDEHGLEPVSGIFSSPFVEEQDVIASVQSDESDVEGETLHHDKGILTSRKTPRIAPARNATPKHTNVGSPKHMSSVKPGVRLSSSEDELSPIQSHARAAPNRVLNFATSTNKNRKSLAVLDDQSPFKPKKNLRRSPGSVHVDTVPLPEPLSPQDVARATLSLVEQQEAEGDEREVIEQSIEVFVPEYDGLLQGDDVQSEIGDFEESEMTTTGEKSTNLRETFSGLVAEKAQTPSELQSEDQAQPSSKKKRERDSRTNDDSGNAEMLEDLGASAKRKRPRVVDEDPEVATHDNDDDVIDPSVLEYGGEDVDQVPEESEVAQMPEEPEIAQMSEEPEPAPVSSKKPQQRGKKSAKGMPKERDANQAMKRRNSASNTKSAGTGDRQNAASNRNLRATTPFEDADHKTSRSGRNLIKPLKYWENEALIWDRGSIAGIVRSDPVVQADTKKGKKRGRKRGPRQNTSQEDDGSETESIMPDEWEHTQGVITGQVAKWNPDTNSGDPNDPVKEDLGFAAASIVTRDVVGADFKFAKIMTIPFFGAGIVELPPEGFKRAKNSRNKQMLFFVHEGKVMVEVGAVGLEMNQFALTKGGCWSVPRGNNYAIVNESRTRTAKIFFAQGCVADENSEIS